MHADWSKECCQKITMDFLVEHIAEENNAKYPF